MVSDVRGWLYGSLPNFGWLLENDSETSPTTFRAFYTREGANWRQTSCSSCVDRSLPADVGSFVQIGLSMTPRDGLH
jgi:hypothetical protein